MEKDFRALLDLVDEVLKAQEEYFSTRTRFALKHSKMLEAKLKRTVAELKAKYPAAKQAELIPTVS